MPKRIQLHRTKGWRLPPGAKSVARPSSYGNPFRVGDIIEIPIDDGRAWLWCVITPEVAVACFRSWLADDAQAELAAAARAELRGHDLGCYCPVDAEWCHADVLIELANREP